LANLGIELRGNESSMEACVQQTKDLLSAYTDDEILSTRQMTDPTLIMAMKFLGKLGTGMTMIMPGSAPYVMQRIIELSLSHGMSPVSPIGFVYYGSYTAKLGDISEGYHHVKLAVSLLDKVGLRDSAGEVIALCTQVKTYVEPLQATLEYHHDGYAAAMASGDSGQALINTLLNCIGSFFAGSNLQRMRDRFADAIKLSAERKQLNYMLQAQQVQHSVSKLIGAGEELNYSSEGRNILASNSSVVRSFHYQTAYVSFMFRSYDDMVENIEKYFAFQETTWACLFFAHAVHAFYTGLISFWVARKSSDRQQWHERGERSKLALKKWAESSLWTFEHKWYLLEAEESYYYNDFEVAELFYEKAISSAKEHKVR
jgi:histidine kinase